MLCDLYFLSLAFYKCSVMEGFNDWIDDCKIQANDADSGKFGNVTYHITHSEVSCILLFNMDCKAFVISLLPLLLE